jgi:hypothetical protein
MGFLGARAGADADGFPWSNAMLQWQRTGFHFQPEMNWMNGTFMHPLHLSFFVRFNTDVFCFHISWFGRHELTLLPLIFCSLVRPAAYVLRRRHACRSQRLVPILTDPFMEYSCTIVTCWIAGCLARKGTLSASSYLTKYITRHWLPQN